MLIVEDEPAMAELLSTALGYEGWQTRSVGDAGTAIQAACEFGPDVVVLDMMLPHLDGPTVLRKLRTDLPGVPLLVLSATAKEDVEDRIAGLLRGEDD
ncbi:response regulator [Streptomyces sp. Ag82_O1-15]|uniref:response regulator n=1 Tax=Streptomyces sp. Ag82_O1-15 TaxID=1938855 RepID=UPI00359CAEF2